VKRREFITLLGGAAAWPLATRAQQGQKIRRIGFLANDPTIPTEPAGKAFLDGLREHGFVEGENIAIERRFTQGEITRSSELAADLVRLDVSLIVASGTNNAVAVKDATRTIPIVMVNVFDPVGLGIVNSIGSPGRNITGVSNHISPEMAGKRLQLLMDAIPGISRLAVFRNPDFPSDRAQWDYLEQVTPSLNVKLIALSVRNLSELSEAFATIRQDRPDALFGLYNAQILIFRKLIVDFVAEQGLPAMYPLVELAEAGGLMSYGTSRTDLFRRAASYVARILNGANAADMPIEQPTKFDLVINLKAAKALGLALPPQLLARADEVIE
jgi:putative tryptophan/tyrosine transport system substrate-binding protein